MAERNHESNFFNQIEVLQIEVLESSRHNVGMLLVAHSERVLLTCKFTAEMPVRAEALKNSKSLGVLNEGS